MAVVLWTVENEALWLRDRWIEQYGDGDADSKELAEKLAALGPNPTPKQVDKTFASHEPKRGYSNRVRRSLECDSCGKSSKAGIIVEAADEGHDWSKIYVCDKCLRKGGYVRS